MLLSSFPNFLALSQISVPYSCGFVSGFSILFYWSMCLCLCQYILSWLLQFCSITWSLELWCLQLCFAFSRLLWLCRVFWDSIQIVVLQHPNLDNFFWVLLTFLWTSNIYSKTRLFVLLCEKSTFSEKKFTGRVSGTKITFKGCLGALVGFRLLISAQVMTSLVVRLSPKSGSVLTVQSLLGILSLPLCPSPNSAHSLSQGK